MAKPLISPRWSPWIMTALVVFVIVPCIAIVMYRA